MWAPHAPVSRATTRIAEKGQSVSTHLFSAPSSRLNPFSFSPSSSCSSFLSDISLRHLSQILFSVLPRQALSFFRDGSTTSGNKNNCEACAAPAVTSGRGPGNLWPTRRTRVKERIWSYLLLTSRFTQEPCAAPTHIAFGLQRSEMHVGERGVRPGQQTSEGCRGRCQKCPLDARPGSVSWVSLGALVAQLLWGSQGSRSRWGLHEGSESRLHAVLPGAITRAWSPATSQPGLHLGLTRRTLETDKTEEDALTRLLPAERSSPLQR